MKTYKDCKETVMHKGKLLVAHPSLEGTMFERSVIYVYQDNSYGTQGLILNRVSQYSVDFLLENKGFEGTHKGEYVYMGGPLQTSSISLLHTDDFSSQNTQYIGNNICISSDNFMLEKIEMGNEPWEWRILVGISGWSPMQLAMEIEGNTRRHKQPSWLTTDADTSIVFEYDGDKQWEKAVELCSRNMFDEYF